MSHFDEAVNLLLINEGGLLISDGEGGGGANFGITLTTLRTYRKDQSLSLDDLRALAVDEAKEIYKALYWDKLSLEGVTHRLPAIILLDQAVNRGVGGAITQLRLTLEKRFGVTDAALTSAQGLIGRLNPIPEREFFRRFVCDTQLYYLDLAQRRPDKAKNLKGWLVRTHNLLRLLV